MKKLLLALLLPVAVFATGCKTTEANYKAAYDTAAAKRNINPDDGLDENVRRLLALDRKNVHSRVVVGSDSLKVTTLFVTMESGPFDKVPQYSVVANAFSQVFNAKALCGRLQEAGFDSAYVFKTGTPDYYVAAAGSDDIARIPELLKKLNDAGNPGSRPGFPAVIRSGGYRPK